jgi:hypothetical protein
MRGFLRRSPWLLVGVLLVGCGGSMINARGRVTKGGQPFAPTGGANLRIFFVPMNFADSRFETYPAVFDAKDGTFEVKGKDGNGLPPGKYRVNLELMTKKADVWKGKLMGDKSPFTCEVSKGNEIVINLDEAKLD